MAVQWRAVDGEQTYQRPCEQVSHRSRLTSDVQLSKHVLAPFCKWLEVRWSVDLRHMGKVNYVLTSNLNWRSLNSSRSTCADRLVRRSIDHGIKLGVIIII